MILTADLRPTPAQARILAFRMHANIASLGGRGGGKSTCALLDVLDHVRTYQSLARPLILRESHVGMQEIQGRLYLYAQAAFGPSVTMNKQEGSMTFPNGAAVSLSNVSDLDSYAKHQGKNYTMLVPEELGNYPIETIGFVNLLRSNLRGPPGMRPHVHLTGNPHGRAHGYVVKHYLNKAPFWMPYRENGDGDYWVNASTTLDDNPHIDREKYRRQLKAATAHDENLQKAWIDGDWSHFVGGMFDVLNPAVHVRTPPNGTRWRYQGAVDFGTASPSVILLLGEVLDYTGSYRPGDIFVLGEADTCPSSDDLSVGDGTPPAGLAEMAKQLLEKHRARPGTHFVVDDARGIAGPNDTVVNIFNECDVWASRPYSKNRVQGWALIRQLLQCVTDGNGPGLFIAPECSHLLETLQQIPRDPLHSDDIARRCPIDHHADALRMGLVELFNGATATSGRTIGGY